MEAIENFPWFVSSRQKIEGMIDEQPLSTQITAPEWMDYWRPLLGRIHDLRQQKPQRIIIGIGAPPGSGKTVFAHQLAWLLAKGMIKQSRPIVLPMAGFYYSRDYLISRRRKLDHGADVALMDILGAPDTFDLVSFAAAVRRLKTQPDAAPTVSEDGEEKTADFWWPAYSRLTEIIKPRGLRVSPKHNVVIVEGPYTLLDRGPLAGVPDIFDLRIYLEAPAASVIRWMVDQRVARGYKEHVAKEYVKRIDLKYARLAEASKPAADVVIERSIDHLLIGLHFKDASAAAQPAPAATPADADASPSPDSTEE